MQYWLLVLVVHLSGTTTNIDREEMFKTMDACFEERERVIQRIDNVVMRENAPINYQVLCMQIKKET